MTVCRVFSLVVLFSFAITAGTILPGTDRISGYVAELPTLSFQWDTSDVQWSNLVHARLNYDWYPVSSIAFSLAGRVQLFSGNQATILVVPGPLLEPLSNDRGYVDLTDAWPSVLYTNIDRLWVSYTRSNLVLAAGRQRINWATNFVWNPNDWFNAFQYLDFDYEERPGTDGLRLTYYAGAVSVVEMAVRAAQTFDNRVYAAMYRFNKFNYDWQFQGGLYGRDAALGFSWSGDIFGGGFRGEVSSYMPVLDPDGTFSASDSITAVAAVGGDYTFENGFYISTEALYNGFGSDEPLDPLLFLTQDFSAKNLTPAKYLVYGSVAYPFTPLINGAFAAIVSPEDRSLYLSPSLTISLFQNTDLLAIAQLFFGGDDSIFGASGNLAGLRLRWNF